MDELRPAARAYLIATALAASAAALLALDHAAAPAPNRLALAAALAGATLLAWLFPLHIAASTKLHLDTAVLVATILLFEPGVALVIIGAGTGLGQLLRRQPWDQTLFNAAQSVLLAAAGGGALAALGWRVDHLALDRPGPMLLVAAVGGALVVIGTLNVATIVALQTGERPVRAWARALRRAGAVEETRSAWTSSGRPPGSA